MDLKIDFLAKDNGQMGKDLHASIKYDGVIDDFPLNRNVTEEEFKNESSDIHSFLKNVRQGLNDSLTNLKNEKKPVTASTIIQAFLENNKALLS